MRVCVGVAVTLITPPVEVCLDKCYLGMEEREGERLREGGREESSATMLSKPLF